MSKPSLKNNPPILSLTGGIGAGKSSVAKIFRALGIPVYNADAAAKDILVLDSAVIAGVKDLFGQDAYKNGELNRDFLASQVFGNESLRMALNALVHPAVANHFREWHAALAHAPYVVKEAAIAIETGIYKEADWLALVTAPEALRIQRVLQRNGVKAEDVKKRMEAQWSDEKKIPLADFLITNDGIQAVLPKTLQIHHTILTSLNSGKTNFEKKLQ